MTKADTHRPRRWLPAGLRRSELVAWMTPPIKRLLPPLEPSHPTASSDASQRVRAHTRPSLGQAWILGRFGAWLCSGSAAGQRHFRRRSGSRGSWYPPVTVVKRAMPSKPSAHSLLIVLPLLTERSLQLLFFPADKAINQREMNGGREKRRW